MRNSELLALLETWLEANLAGYKLENVGVRRYGEPASVFGETVSLSIELKRCTYVEPPK